MTTAAAPSLFDQTSAQSLGAASAWLSGTLSGTAATAICVLAIAFLGLMMMAGRLPVRDGVRVVLGCFVLLGAPIIAGGFLASWSAQSDPPLLLIEPEVAHPRPDLPPTNYDPYAGASLRRD